MKASPPPSSEVDAYIAEKSDFARPICIKLREIIRRAAPSLSESIRWGGPSYKGQGLVLGMAAFKEHVTLYFFRGAELENVKDLLQHGKGNATMRSAKFASLKDVDIPTLTKILKQAAKLDAEGPLPAKKRAKRAELPVPAVLTAALKKHPVARKYFESLPPSSRREFCEWIGEAKREETAQRRLEKAIHMLTEGRRMNDQYR